MTEAIPAPVVPDLPPPKNTQEAYERIRAHFTQPDAQLGRIDGAHGSCRYRAVVNGGKVVCCAIGCMIPDSLYAVGMEGASVHGLMHGGHHPGGKRYDYPEVSEYFGAVTEDFLKRAQSYHDSSEDVTAFVSRLDYLAAEFGMTPGGAE